MAAASMKMIDCSICCSEINEDDIFTCGIDKCGCQVCVPCLTRYIFESLNMPNCPACRGLIALEPIFEKFGATSLLDELRTHTAKVTLVMQKNLLPQTQALLMQKETKEMENKDEYDLRLLIKALRKEASSIQVYDQHFNENTLAKWQKRQLLAKVAYHKCELEILALTAPKSKKVTGSASTTVMKTYVGPCSTPDCRGYFDSEGLCSICSKLTCLKCTLSGGEGHICKPEDVKSAKEINDSTKPCPKCKVRIHRPYGCNHMFCTHCKTSFDWQSGRIIPNSQNSSPYYYQWMARQGVEPRRAVDECPQNRQLRSFYTCMDRFRYVRTKLFKEDPLPLSIEQFTNLHRTVVHIQNVELSQRQRDNVETKKLNLRIQYLNGSIDEKWWARRLKSIEKLNDKTQRSKSLMTMYVSTMIEYFDTFVSKSLLPAFTDLNHQARSILEQMVSLRNFFNQRMHELSSYLEGLKMPYIDYHCNFVKHRKYGKLIKSVDVRGEEGSGAVSLSGGSAGTSSSKEVSVAVSISGGSAGISSSKKVSVAVSLSGGSAGTSRKRDREVIVLSDDEVPMTKRRKVGVVELIDDEDDDAEEEDNHDEDEDAEEDDNDDEEDEDEMEIDDD